MFSTQKKNKGNQLNEGNLSDMDLPRAVTHLKKRKFKKAEEIFLGCKNKFKLKSEIGVAVTRLYTKKCNKSLTTIINSNNEKLSLNLLSHLMCYENLDSFRAVEQKDLEIETKMHWRCWRYQL